MCAAAGSVKAVQCPSYTDEMLKDVQEARSCKADGRCRLNQPFRDC